MQPGLRATLVVAVIVIASAIAGAAIDRTFLVHPPRRGSRAGTMTPEQDARRRGEMLDRLSHDLNLAPAQRVAIDSIFQQTDSSLRSIRHEMQPRIQQVLEHSRAEIGARLDSTQRAKFAKRSAARDSARRASRP